MRGREGVAEVATPARERRDEATADAGSAARAWQVSLVLVAVTSGLHLVVAGRVGLGTDEAHYALYGQRLDWCYVDHPPLVGWLSALVQALLGSGSLALRLPAMLLMAATCLALHGVTRRLFPQDSPWIATLAVGLWQGSLAGQLLGLALVPETPLLLIALAAVACLHEVLRRGDTAPTAHPAAQHDASVDTPGAEAESVAGTTAPWLALGLALGLAGLTKLTAVLLVPSVLAALAVEGRLRQVRSPRALAAAALALACVAPVLIWNAGNDWATLAYQLDRGAGGRDWEVGRATVSQLIPLPAYSPALWLFGLAGLAAAWGQRRHRGVRLLALVALGPLVVFGLASGRRVTLPHWTALSWLALAPLAARWIWAQRRRRWVRGVVIGTALLDLAVVVGLHAHLLVPWMPLPDHARPLAALTGWETAAARALELQDELSATPGPAPRLFSDNWSRTSRLAWYARPEPVIPLDRRSDQFDHWFGNALTGDRGVLVVWDDEGEEGPPRDLALFEHTELLDELPVRIGGRLAATFRFYGCHGLRAATP